MADGLCNREGYLFAAALDLMFYIHCPGVLSNTVSSTVFNF